MSSMTFIQSPLLNPLCISPIRPNTSRKRIQISNLARPCPTPSHSQRLSQDYLSAAASLTPFTSPRIPRSKAQHTKFGDASQTPYSWRSPPKKRKATKLKDRLDAEGKEPLSSGYASHIATPPPPPSSPLNNDEEINYPSLRSDGEEIANWLDSLPPTPSKKTKSMVDQPIYGGIERGEENITPITSPSPSPSPERCATRTGTASPIRTPTPSRFKIRSKPHLSLPPRRPGGSAVHIDEDMPASEVTAATNAESAEQELVMRGCRALDQDRKVDVNEAEQQEGTAGKVMVRSGAADMAKDMTIKRADMVRALRTLSPSPRFNVMTGMERRRKLGTESLVSGPQDPI